MNSIFSGWNIVRLLRLAIGIAAIVQAFQQNSWAIGIAGFFLMLLAIANVACNSCTINNYKHSKSNTEKIKYEYLVK